VPRSVGGKAEQAGDSTSLEIVARAGLIAYGVVHLLVGWLAMKIAWSAAKSKSGRHLRGAENTGEPAVWQGPAGADRGRSDGARALAGE
jgi:hypothetical protein